MPFSSFSGLPLASVLYRLLFCDFLCTTTMLHSSGLFTLKVVSLPSLPLTTCSTECGYKATCDGDKLKSNCDNFICIVVIETHPGPPCEGGSVSQGIF